MSAMQVSEIGLVTTERARLEHEYRTFLQEALHLGPWVTYVPNRWLPLLRLYRFKEAFSLRYDYSYCFELCFGFVRDFQELRNLRHSLLRSHIESRVDGHDGPASPAIREVLDCLAQKNLNNSKIPDMIRGYFADMAAVIRGLSRVLAPRGRVAMVVDNVRFEGEMIPVDLILCRMAEEMGLQVEAILICRFKGNSSQQMARYGRLPVRESVVVWRKA